MTAKPLHFIDLSTQNPHLPHNSTEIEGTPPADAADMETALRNADMLISQLMQEETQRLAQQTERHFEAA